MRIKYLPLAVLFFLPFLAGAQETKPIIRFSPLYTQNINIEETRFIESLIQSYLSDVGNVVNYFEDNPQSSTFETGGALPDTWKKTPDYVISGSIYLERDSRIFTLEIHNTLTKETTRTTTVHKTASDLALKVRSLVENAFNASLQATKAAAPADTGRNGNEQPEMLTENNITGTWRGESGIELIRLLQGGKGIAFFSSGAQMNLTYTIENNTLKVRQNSPNRERFYYPLPYGIAKQLSAEADPMYWELLLYSGGTHLRGVRISTEAEIEGNSLVKLLPGTSRDSLWVRINR